jgi:hypothetical protein
LFVIAQVRQYLRSNLPVGRLIILHLMESVGFVPVAVGVLFFLFEFLNDQLLASSVLLSAWVCEMYTVVSVRTRISMRFFPKVFFLVAFVAFALHSSNIVYVGVVIWFLFILIWCLLLRISLWIPLFIIIYMRRILESW